MTKATETQTGSQGQHHGTYLWNWSAVCGKDDQGQFLPLLGAEKTTTHMYMHAHTHVRIHMHAYTDSTLVPTLSTTPVLFKR